MDKENVEEHHDVTKNEKSEISGMSSQRMVLNLNQPALDLKISIQRQNENMHDKENISYVDSQSKGRSNYKSSKMSSNSNKKQIVNANGS